MNNQKTVLVADDDPTLRKGMEVKFKAAGYNVITAADGEEAINQALEFKPDLIVIDQLMPKFTGLAALKRIRSDFDWGRHVPSIVMTNVAEGTSAHRELVMVANRYFVKSNTSLDTLLKTAAQLLGMDSSAESTDNEASAYNDTSDNSENVNTAAATTVQDSNDPHDASGVEDTSDTTVEQVEHESATQAEQAPAMQPQAPQNTAQPQSEATSQDPNSPAPQTNNEAQKDIDEDLVNQAL